MASKAEVPKKAEVPREEEVPRNRSSTSRHGMFIESTPYVLDEVSGFNITPEYKFGLSLIGKESLHVCHFDILASRPYSFMLVEWRERGSEYERIVLE